MTRHEVLALDLLTTARRALQTKVRDGLVPRARLALHGYRIRVTSGEHVQRAGRQLCPGQIEDRTRPTTLDPHLIDALRPLREEADAVAGAHHRLEAPTKVVPAQVRELGADRIVGGLDPQPCPDHHSQGPQAHHIAGELRVGPVDGSDVAVGVHQVQGDD